MNTVNGVPNTVSAIPPPIVEAPAIPPAFALLATGPPTAATTQSPHVSLNTQQIYFARKKFEQEYKLEMKNFKTHHKVNPSVPFASRANKLGINFGLLDHQKPAAKLLQDAFAQLSNQEKYHLFQLHACAILGQPRDPVALLSELVHANEADELYLPGPATPEPRKRKRDSVPTLDGASSKSKRARPEATHDPALAAGTPPLAIIASPAPLIRQHLLLVPSMSPTGQVMEAPAIGQSVPQSFQPSQVASPPLASTTTAQTPNRRSIAAKGRPKVTPEQKLQKAKAEILRLLIAANAALQSATLPPQTLANNGSLPSRSDRVAL